MSSTIPTRPSPHPLFVVVIDHNNPKALQQFCSLTIDNSYVQDSVVHIWAR